MRASNVAWDTAGGRGWAGGFPSSRDSPRRTVWAGDDAAEMLANRTAVGDQEFLAGMKAQVGVGTASNHP